MYEMSYHIQWQNGFQRFRHSSQEKISIFMKKGKKSDDGNKQLLYEIGVRIDVTHVSDSQECSADCLQCMMPMTVSSGDAALASFSSLDDRSHMVFIDKICDKLCTFAKFLMDNSRNFSHFSPPNKFILYTILLVFILIHTFS